MKKRKLADAQYWNVTLSNWKKHSPEFFYKNAVLKFFALLTGKHLCEIFKNTILKIICVQLLLNWLYKVIVLNFVSWSHLKPSRLNNITSRFQTRVLAKFDVYIIYIYLTPTLSYKPNFYMFITGYYTKNKCLDSLLKDVMIYFCVIWLDREYCRWNCAAATLEPIY